ncbi:MAG: FprA family A-type flavoprotein [Anaerotignum sp.]|nr:FprA family A-type flavoprotein [Anaerotignum sp.]
MITNDLKYIGVNDHEIDLFEGQFIVPDGMAYNSYAIIDEKIAIMDSVERKFTEEWLNNIKEAVGERQPDYLIVNQMEPDHSANIRNFLQTYPEAKVVASANAFRMMQNFFGTDFSDRRIVIKDGDKLNLGKHELTFLTAPMVHWPEVIMTYDACDKVLFSADAFGKFGALDVEDEWECEARRYYFGIVGKYGPQVQAVLKKAAALDIQSICPLHGPVLKENVDHYIGLYDTWSSYGVESEGVVIAYTSIYGHTKAAVELLAQKLEEKGCPKVVLTDLARSDWAEAVEDAFRYGKLVLATTTYNADIFPDMKHFIQHLAERNFQNRTVGLIENGSWAPKAAGIMKEMLSECKNLTFTDTTVKILSALNEESIAQVEALAQELCGQEEAAVETQAEEKKTKKYICTVCGYEHEGELPADYECPLCGVGPDLFELAE